MKDLKKTSHEKHEGVGNLTVAGLRDQTMERCKNQRVEIMNLLVEQVNEWEKRIRIYVLLLMEEIRLTS